MNQVMNDYNIMTNDFFCFGVFGTHAEMRQAYLVDLVDLFKMYGKGEGREWAANCVCVLYTVVNANTQRIERIKCRSSIKTSWRVVLRLEVTLTPNR